jgi:hypothetical protein
MRRLELFIVEVGQHAELVAAETKLRQQRLDIAERFGRRRIAIDERPEAIKRYPPVLYGRKHLEPPSLQLSDVSSQSSVGC